MLILGGRSEIGIELARRLARGATVILAARKADQLTEQVAAVLAAGAMAVHTREFDADDLASHGALVASVIADHGPIDTAVLAFGILGDQARAEADAAHALAVVHTDYVAQVSLLTHLAAAMRQAGRGSLVVFSSVAGVRLLIARPGFVIGRMTQGMAPAPLPSTPEQVAAATARALAKGRRTVWIPWALRPMFFGMRLLPQFIWRRLPR